MNDQPLFKSWTPEQAWTIHLFLERLQSQLQQSFGKDIAEYERRDELMEQYFKEIEQMSEEERAMEGVWIEPKATSHF